MMHGQKNIKLFRAHVVNRDLKNSTHSIVIKLETCIKSVPCQL